jgi:hypothetical protein
MENLINSHGLVDGDVVKCVKKVHVTSNREFNENDIFIVCNVSRGFYQSDYHEIFLEHIDNKNKLIKFIYDSDFDDNFIIDIKQTRKRKLEKLFKNEIYT